MAQNLKFSNGGFSARVSYNSDHREWKARFYRADGSYMAEADYFTDSKIDAIQTAQDVIGKLSAESASA